MLCLQRFLDSEDHKLKQNAKLNIYMYLVRYLSISSDVLATAFFTTRRYASVACAMVPSVCLSVCRSQADVLRNSHKD